MDTITQKHKTKVHAPKLRFKEFKESWIKQSLENRINLISGIALKSEEISEDANGTRILRGINITEGYIRHNNDIDRYYTKPIIGLEKYLVKKGDLVIGMDGSKVGKNVAVISDADDNSILIQRVARLRAINNTNIDFIYHHINSIRFHKYVDEVNTSSGIPHISAKQINDFSIFFPSLPEQEKIAAFLTAVDEKIQQLKHKKQLLEQYKKGVMQQLFSGKLRFKIQNEVGELVEPPKWEEKKLGEISIINMGQSPDSKSYNNDSIGMLLIQGNADINGRVSNPRQWTSEPTKKCDIGDLILTVRAPVGYIAKSLHTACIGRGVCSIKNNELTDIEFLYQFLIGYEDKWARIEQGSTFTAVNGNDIKSIKLKIPCLEEQKKIADFLSAIDDKINGVAEGLEATTQFKKGLLQQMFV